MMEDGINDISGLSKTTRLQEEDAVVGIQFSPPVYLQRYMLAVDYLTKHSIQKVVDFGCSECGFFQLLSTVPSLQEISLVDIDRDLLLKQSRVISPQVRDYIYRRCNPLSVSMYAGSAEDFDDRVKNYEAVTLIEVIEHLEPHVLKSVTENVFGNIHPSHIVVTTPNSEFNVMFGNEDPKAFRHWDHKFEWNRPEFHVWCENVCESYGYTVEYTGVGYLPSKQEISKDVGPCSQAAFFRLRNEIEDVRKCSSETVGCADTYYELIAESTFPYDDRQLTEEEKLDLEISYVLRKIALAKTETPDEEDADSIFVNICQMANRRCIKELASIDKVRAYLEENSYQFSEDGDSVIIHVVKFLDPVGSDDGEDDNHADASDFNDDYYSGDGNCPDNLRRCESDWDLEIALADGKNT